MKKKMLAILSTILALVGFTISASAVLNLEDQSIWIDYQAPLTSETFRDYPNCSAEVSGMTYHDIVASTYADGQYGISSISVSLGWSVNMNPGSMSDSISDSATDGEAMVAIDTSEYIDTDYEIYSFSSEHTVTNWNYSDWETIYIGVSS